MVFQWYGYNLNFCKSIRRINSASASCATLPCLVLAFDGTKTFVYLLTVSLTTEWHAQSQPQSQPVPVSVPIQTMFERHPLAPLPCSSPNKWPAPNCFFPISVWDLFWSKGNLDDSIVSYIHICMWLPFPHLCRDFHTNIPTYRYCCSEHTKSLTAHPAFGNTAAYSMSVP